jgi:hypothetical protein
MEKKVTAASATEVPCADGGSRNWVAHVDGWSSNNGGGSSSCSGGSCGGGSSDNTLLRVEMKVLVGEEEVAVAIL